MSDEYNEYILMNKYELIKEILKYKEQSDYYIRLLKNAKELLNRSTFLEASLDFDRRDLCTEIENIFNKEKI
jgi:hypothetical protein